MATAVLPDGPTTPRAIQGAIGLSSPIRAARHLRDRYGSAFMVNMPLFGRALVISDPAEVKQLFTTPPELVDNFEFNLGRVLGPGSFFALSGDEHKRQRKLLVPPFHGRRLATYESLIEEETVREMASWPEGREFATLESMMRITLNIILRAVFGAEGAELQELRELLPSFVKWGSRLAVLPIPRHRFGRLNPWVRFDGYRRDYDAIVTRLIAKAEADPQLEQREDILAMMLQARYDDGGRMTHSQISDQLLTLLTAGHETTATTLAWAVERLRRHPEVLRRLADEVDAGGSELREAAIWEVQRVRPVIDVTGRQVRADTLQLGRWTLRKGQMVIVSLFLLHDNDELFPDARRFDPDRFVGDRPDSHTWVPFGGGARRCIGASFAHLEMNVVLRTLLRDFRLAPTTAADERWHSRGVASAPAKGGRIVVHRRPVRPVGRVAAAVEVPA
ncbi:MAG: cytochrome family [Pseudonocardiales bacterium]|nr:cytochrome family [Pseudonocardiales bacterium]